MSLIVPAVLPATEKQFFDTLAFFSSLPQISRVQIDVVDGRFASPASWPYTAPKEFRDRVVRAEMLPYLDRIEYEIDLMCFDAEEASAAWLALGATRLTFHAESDTLLARLLATARKRYGHIVAFGIALNIASSIELIEPHLDDIEYVQFMGISHIGKQGQPFDPRVIEKIHIFRSRHPDIPIQVDGGVSLASAKQLIKLGVSELVVGSGILRSSDPERELNAYRAIETEYRV